MYSIGRMFDSASIGPKGIQMCIRDRQSGSDLGFQRKQLGVDSSVVNLLRLRALLWKRTG